MRWFSRAFALLAIAAPSVTAEPALRVDHVGLVAPDVLGVTLADGYIDYGQQVPYVPAQGDEIDEQHFPHRWLKRNGEYIGAIAGENKGILVSFDIVQGRGVDAAQWCEPQRFSLTSQDDPDYTTARAADSVYRKTKPNDMGRTGPWTFDASLEHTLYLRFPAPLKEGKRYTLELPDKSLTPCEFTFASRELRSEAVHASQIGFRPDDPAKVGFLSCWMGDGGGLAYAEGAPFQVVRERDGAVRFEGTVQLSKAADDCTEDAHQRNYNGTDVYILDFSPFQEPGVYRLVVPGIGFSYPFPIADDVWQDAFRVSARGFYHMRSGIELGPPYTDYQRPRCFRPDDGVRVYASTATLLDTKNGPLGTEVEPTNFGNLVAGRTDELVPDAWGGYMDAGDWDRRIQHLLASQYLLELAGLFPAYFPELDLNVPESANELPDIVDEALFNIDCYRRLQTPEGGVRGGIESEEHPRYGETSWQESLTVLAYAPGPWSSYLYAGTAAKAAFWLEQHAPERAEAYRESALRAMEWAEAQPKQFSAAADSRGGAVFGALLCVLILLGLNVAIIRYWPERGRVRQVALVAACAVGAIAALAVGGGQLGCSGYTVETGKANAVRDARNYAAAELFRLTGDPSWHDVFIETSALVDAGAPVYQWRSHDQEHGAWVFARTDRPGMDEALKRNCRNAIIRVADERLAMCESTGFRWAKHPWRPFGVGIPSAPDAVALVRAHVLTGEEKYLRGAVLTCQVGAGGNPSNLCFTTGVGIAYPRHPLHLDSRLSHQTPPPGLTALGPRDVTSEAFAGDWGRKLLRPHCYPELESWPPIESYMDVFWNSPLCEFTIHLPMAQNAYVWGYLAART